MNAPALSRLFAVACLAGAAPALAADISTIEPSVANVTLAGGKVVVRFTVVGTAASGERCGYSVEYGDGKARDVRVIDQESGRFTRSHERTFTRQGMYTVSVRGRKVEAAGRCSGTARAMVAVGPAGQQPPIR